MKLLFLSLMLIGCGQAEYHSTRTKTECQVTKTDTGSVIICKDGTKVIVVNGRDGKDSVTKETVITTIKNEEIVWSSDSPNQNSNKDKNKDKKCNTSEKR